MGLIVLSIVKLVRTWRKKPKSGLHSENPHEIKIIDYSLDLLTIPIAGPSRLQTIGIKMNAQL
ncbi:hypothetical protein [Leptospira santarosai]|nr:hypothetical protein B2G51_17095 [Leptospira santarosai]OLY65552.1 hypothetical protein BWD11_03315 [Leptospira santarosai serovar Grippotyphosa]ONF81158.1 hypothetical protein BWD12_03215 [Leptospira santarosai serovar Bananal]ONF89223.1 hypothetical protein BWD13_02245 [Leptospira santarosai serovar Grippotyphosa]